MQPCSVDPHCPYGIIQLESLWGIVMGNPYGMNPSGKFVRN